jgi:excisionase family DNA binding protein
MKRGPIITRTFELNLSVQPDEQVASLPERIERNGRALTAQELAELLNVSDITLFKYCKAGRIPCFRIGTAVRFDPVSVARWLRTK